MNALTLACGPTGPLFVLAWLLQSLPTIGFAGLAVTIVAAAALR